jgi:hypothetical protein
MKRKNHSQLGPTVHLAFACAIRARRELYVYYISDVKFSETEICNDICLKLQT